MVPRSSGSALGFSSCHRARGGDGGAAGVLSARGLATLGPGGRAAAWGILPRLGGRAGQLSRGVPVPRGLRHAGRHHLLRLVCAALLLRGSRRQVGAGGLHQRPRRAGASWHHRATCLCPLPDRRLHLHRLHHFGLFSGYLLLHLFETQGALSAAHPLLAPKLSDRDLAHDPHLHQPQSSFQAVQHRYQLQLHGRICAEVLLCQG